MNDRSIDRNADAPSGQPGAVAAKPAGVRLGLSNYVGLALALIALIALFSTLSSHFLTYDTRVSVGRIRKPLLEDRLSAAAPRARRALLIKWRFHRTFVFDARCAPRKRPARSNA